jgi:hypothetical protein
VGVEQVARLPRDVDDDRADVVDGRRGEVHRAVGADVVLRRERRDGGRVQRAQRNDPSPVSTPPFGTDATWEATTTGAT